jgi:putative nucleic acid binding protein
MRLVRKILFLTVAIAIGVAIAFYRNRPRDIKLPPPEIEITANELSAAFSANPQDAERKYLSKVLSLTGEIKGKNGIFGDYWLRFKTSSPMPIYCKFRGKDGAGSYEASAPGRVITVIGICEKKGSRDKKNSLWVDIKYGFLPGGDGFFMVLNEARLPGAPD